MTARPAFLYTPTVPKSSARPGWLLPVLTLAIVLPLAYFVHRLPGDPQVARFIQSLPPGTGPAWWVTTTVTRPMVYGLIALGIGLATWRGRLRGLVAAGALVALWWYAGEPLKELIRRPRPTAAFVEVARPSSGYSFPSTFATTWFSVWLPVAVYAWRTRQRQAGTVIAGLAGLAIVVGLWARVRMGAHWPSDLLMTLAMVWATFALIELAVDRVDGPA